MEDKMDVLNIMAIPFAAGILTFVVTFWLLRRN